MELSEEPAAERAGRRGKACPGRTRMVSPSVQYMAGKAYPKAVYANDSEYFAGIAKAYKTEPQNLYDPGLRNEQIDDPNLACKTLQTG
jgi:methionine synthase II (cobalamin-independent)